MFLWQVCAEPVLAHFCAFASFSEANLVLQVHCVPVSSCCDDLIDGNVGEASVAKMERRYAVGGADATLYRADLAYTQVRNLCLDVLLQPIDCGGPCLD